MAKQILLPDEWKSIDQRIISALKDPTSALNWITSEPASMGSVAEEFWKYNKLGMLDVGETFPKADADILTASSDIQRFVSIEKGIYIDRDKIDAARSGSSVHRNLILVNAQEAAEKVLEGIDEIAYLGTAQAAASRSSLKKDIGIKGLFNAAGVNTLGDGGAGLGNDDDLTSFGDINLAVIPRMKQKLKEDGHWGKNGYTFIMSPGVATQLQTNKSAATDYSELDYVRRDHPDVSLITSTRLCVDALSTSNQEAMLVENDPDNFKLKYSYPVHKAERAVKETGDVHFALLWRGAIELNRPTSVCVSDTLTTSYAY